MGSVFTWSQKFWIADQSCSDTLGSVALSVKEIKIKNEKKYTPPPRFTNKVAAKDSASTAPGDQTQQADS